MSDERMSLGCGRDRCLGKSCGNFGEKSCKGGFEFPPWSWARWYLEELPKITERVNKERISVG